MIVDYVVVGAGAAGCVVASRLAADPDVQVLLVEGGGSGRDPLLSVPRAFHYTMRSERHVLRYATLPTPAGGPAETWTRGRGLGGSTLVNGMMYVRGAAADFEALQAAGNPGWGAADVLGAYRELEDHALGASPSRGAGGPLAVSVPQADDGVVSALFAAAGSIGLRRTHDFNDSDDERIGFTPATIHRGRRVSAASAFLGPLRGAANLTVMTHAVAERIVLDGTRAVGIVLRQGRRRVEVRCRREVVVSAGTVETPLLLERSGIGRPDVLAAHGVAVVVESPHVGERVVEQRGISLQVRFRDRLGPTERLNTGPRRALEGARYLATRRGPIATSGYDVVSAFRSAPTVERPDAQGVWVPIALDETSERPRPARYSGMLFTGYALRPTTTGSVHLGGAGAEAPPVVAPRYLEHDEERATTAAVLDHARAVVAASPLADLVADEVFPGPAVRTPDQAVAHALATGGGIFHAVGSCAMGPADDDVVDADLRVRGVEGLRVVDASVLPHQVSGNTAAPVMALAWLAGGRITTERSPR